jgi:MYXO-CTERM domain-containing protein
VLTRLHARYGKDALGEDLVFKEAAPIVGGREMHQINGKLETGATVLPAGGISNFQGRYAIRHPWTGPIACKTPRRGIWGGPPGGTPGDHGTKTAQDLAFAPRGGVQLASLVRHDVPEVKLKAAESPATVPAAGQVAPSTATQVPPSTATQGSGCGSCGVGADGGGAPLLAGVAAALAAAAGIARRRHL